MYSNELTLNFEHTEDFQFLFDCSIPASHEENENPGLK